MTKTKLLSTAVIVLVLLNLAMLAFLFFGHKGPRGMHPQNGNKAAADAFIKDRFKFSDDQMKLFIESKEKHKEESQRLNEELSEISKSYYLALGNSIVQDSLWLKISDLNESVYKVNSDHFEEVANICTQEQKPELDKFINGLLSGRKGGGRPASPKDGERK